MAQFFLSAFGFPCPLLSTDVICPFHQTHPHTVIKGHLGIISFLNLAFGGISCSRSLFIFMSINCRAPSNPNQTGCTAFPLLALLQTVYSPPVTPSTPPKPLHDTTYKTHKHTHAQLRVQTSCPWALVVPDYLQFTYGKTHKVTYLHPNGLSNSDVPPLSTACSYPLSLWLNHRVKKGIRSNSTVSSGWSDMLWGLTWVVWTLSFPPGR